MRKLLLIATLILTGTSAFGALPGAPWDTSHTIEITLNNSISLKSLDAVQFTEGNMSLLVETRNADTTKPVCTLYNSYDSRNLSAASRYFSQYQSTNTLAIANNSAVSREKGSGTGYELEAELFLNADDKIENSIDLLCYSDVPFTQEVLQRIFGSNVQVKFK
jgi:hypothetical protein